MLGREGHFLHAPFVFRLNVGATAFGRFGGSVSFRHGYNSNKRFRLISALAAHPWKSSTSKALRCGGFQVSDCLGCLSVTVHAAVPQRRSADRHFSIPSLCHRKVRAEF